MSKNITLSIVILNYNTRDLLMDCLTSLHRLKGEVSSEIIVVDNASVDDSVQTVRQNFPEVLVVESSKNVGFAAGNNLAKKVCRGKFILFLNSDTQVLNGALKETVKYIEENSEIGALTCKVILPDGKLDKDTRRSFPTPWVSFTHFSGIDKVFPGSKIFARYWYGYMPENKIHDVDVVQGAYFLTRKDVLDAVGWFDEDYFLDGEDIDLCFRIKEKGYRIVYYPKVSIIHIKGASKGKKTGYNNSLTVKERKKFVSAGVDSMNIFYKKRLSKRYPLPINMFVYVGIGVLKALRLSKV